MAASMYNVFVGAETGLLKGIDINKKQWGNLNQLEAVDRQHEITAMCWGDSEYKEICVGSRNRMVSILDTESLEFTGSCHLPGGEGVFKGLARVDGSFVTAVDSGLVALWDEEGKHKKVSIDAGENLWRMRQNSDEPKLIATGGKENDLKIWDLESPDAPVFMAKNVRNDWLNLRVPVWVMDMAFVPGSKNVVTVTGHHQMRIYDPSSSQRRPVVDVEFDEYPITSVSMRPGYNQVVIGNTHGKMALMDLRKGQMVQCYKGFAGSIRQIACHPTAPVVASCGLDRHLRIHDIETRALLHKFYLKSRLNRLLLTQDWDNGEEEDDQAAVDKSSEKHGKGAGEDGEDLWETMEELHEKKERKPKEKKKLKRQVSSEEDSDDSEEPEPAPKRTPKVQKSKKKKKQR